MEKEVGQNNTSLPAPENQPTPKEAPQPSTKAPKAPKQKPWFFVGAAAIILLLGTTGFFAYQNYQLKKQAGKVKLPPETSPTPVPEVTSMPSPAPTEIPSPTPTVDPMAEWLNYSEENICYSFKYPKEITLKERKEEEIIYLSLWGPTQKKDTELYDGLSLSFSFPLKIGNTPLKDYVDSKIEESKQFGEILKPREETIINGISGYTYTSEGLGIFQNIYLQSPDKTCVVEITNATQDPTNQGYQETVNQILSTFEFKK
jgi:hypothetical protein